MKIDESTKYDAIVIGSGIGGLTTASLLAEVAGKRVLVLEKHFKLGGFTHSFQRNGYEWDTGVHYVGEMGEGDFPRQIMDLVTGGRVKWKAMGETLERYVFPGESFDVPGNEAAFRVRLIERFPEEESAILDYFKDLRRAQGWFVRWLTAKQYSKWLRPAFTFFRRRLVMQTTGDYMARFKDPMLPAILCGQWPDFGTCPADSAFGWHATVAADFLAGGYYPVGGSQHIASGAKQVIEAKGGRCLVGHEVSEVIIEKGRAVGVRGTRKGKPFDYRAKVIVSNAGGLATVERLVPTPYAATERARIGRLKYGPSSQILFLGLKDDPRKLGFTDANYWLYALVNHDAHSRYRDEQPDRIDGMYVTFQSLKNPDATKHTAQLINFSRLEDWVPVSDGKWLRRGEAYESKKEEISESMIAYADERLPGFKSLIDYKELSTPLTVETFTSHKQGMIYGQRCDANRFDRDAWSIETSIPSLLLTGSDVGSPGVNGAMFAGVMTAGKILGLSGMPRIVAKVL